MNENNNRPPVPPIPPKAPPLPPSRIIPDSSRTNQSRNNYEGNQESNSYSYEKDSNNQKDFYEQNNNQSSYQGNLNNQQYGQNSHYNEGDYTNAQQKPKKSNKGIIIGGILGGIFIFLLLAVFSIYTFYKNYNEVFVEIDNSEEVVTNNNSEQKNNNNVSDEEIYLEVDGVTDEELDAYIERSKSLEIIKDVPSEVSLFIMSDNYLERLSTAYDDELNSILKISEMEDLETLKEAVNEYKSMNQEHQKIYEAFADQNHQGYLSVDIDDAVLEDKWYDSYYYADEITFFHYQLGLNIEEYYEYISDINSGASEYDEDELLYYLEEIDSLLASMEEYSELYIGVYNELIDIYNN